MVKMGSIKAGSFWLSKKAKEEFTNITQDLTVCNFLTLRKWTLFFPVLLFSISSNCLMLNVVIFLQSSRFQEIVIFFFNVYFFCIGSWNISCVFTV